MEEYFARQRRRRLIAIAVGLVVAIVAFVVVCEFQNEFQLSFSICRRLFLPDVDIPEADLRFRGPKYFRG